MHCTSSMVHHNHKVHDEEEFVKLSRLIDNLFVIILVAIIHSLHPLFNVVLRYWAVYGKFSPHNNIIAVQAVRVITVWREWLFYVMHTIVELLKCLLPFLSLFFLFNPLHVMSVHLGRTISENFRKIRAYKVHVTTTTMLQKVHCRNHSCHSTNFYLFFVRNYLP